MSGTLTFVLRPVCLNDREALREIYNHAVRHTTATMDTDERTVEQQEIWIHAHNGAPYPGIVAVAGAAVVGYASLSPFNPKHGYARTVENSLYVHPQWRRRGVGRLLLCELIADAARRGFTNIVALISADNDGSIRLHRELGFVDAGLLRRVGHKHGGWVDVAYLQLILGDEP
jgi:L-amino acid N-acyltransferase YncA